MKTEIHMNKPSYLGLSTLELSKIVMYDYEKTKYGKKQDCCMDTDCFIVFIRTDDISNDIAEDIEIRFDTSNYELDRPLPKR